MKVKDEVLARGFFKINNGSQTRFWEDTWVGTCSFKHLYPTLYNIANRPHNTVASVMRSTQLNISFQRALVGDKTQWMGRLSS